ncbi:unnamed protein product [Blepharisma stoltei]|uniref:Uncharacterized protein n=1 Tax=Blepharisma stoltei TaxID=1481888 RepID=A0AAU9JDH2_9CILI|nr:unnamed protein product [Blepharisma stoltei]
MKAKKYSILNMLSNLSNDVTNQLKQWLEEMNLAEMTPKTQKAPLKRSKIEDMLQYKSPKESTKTLNHLKQGDNQSPLSQSFSYPNESVEDRLIKAGITYSQNKETKRKANEEQKKLEEEKFIQHSEKIRNTGRNEYLHNLSKVYEQKQNQRIIQQTEHENSLIKSPKPCKGSQKILQGSNRKGDVGQRLYNSATKSSKVLKAKQVLSYLDMKSVSSPKINTSYTAHSVKNTNISEKNIEQKYQLLSKQIPVVKEEKYYRSQTPTAARKVSPIRQTKSRESTPIKEFPFKPHISKKSQVIASKLEPSSSRLTKIPRLDISFDDKECTFNPNIDLNSSRLAQRLKDNSTASKTERWEALYELRHHKEEKVVTTSFLDEKILLDDHSPKRTKVEQEKFISKLNGWAKVKDDVLQRKRDESIEYDLKECTFSPKIHGNAQFDEVNLKGFKGVEKYLQRQKTARETPSKEFRLREDKSPPNDHNESKLKCKEMSSKDFLSAIFQLHMQLNND